MLDQPVRGYTNIAAALELGAAELERGRNPRRSGLLITDGVVTAGGDPRPLAHRFPQLFVLLTEDYKMNPELCRELADAGRGDVFPVSTFRELPRAPARRRQPRPALDARSARGAIDCHPGAVGAPLPTVRRGLWQCSAPPTSPSSRPPARSTAS